MTENEIWKDVVGYEGLYQVSNFGNVKSLDRKRFNGRVMANKKGQIISLMTALENQIQADIGGTREEANRVANHILDILDISNENKEQEIRNKAIDEFASTLIPRLTDAIYQKDVESMTNLINDVAEQMKAGVEK